MEELFPKVVFEIFGLPIRDTVIATWLVMAIIMGLAFFLNRRQSVMLEMTVDFVQESVSDVMGEAKTLYVVLIGSLFIFLAVANTIGLIPFLISPTRDVNTALALALIVFFAVHIFGIKEKGVKGYFKDFASPIFMLPMEIIGQISRTISLTLRLFGNIISGDLIVALFLSLLPLFVPLPLMGLSLFTGLIQAYIFGLLAAVFIAAGVQSN
jgi:F-type H+-transporting ATPase subunit a